MPRHVYSLFQVYHGFVRAKALTLSIEVAFSNLLQLFLPKISTSQPWIDQRCSWEGKKYTAYCTALFQSGPVLLVGACKGLVNADFRGSIASAVENSVAETRITQMYRLAISFIVCLSGTGPR
jgi:hypothetical protein